MTKEEIIELARQAGLPEAIIEMTPIAFERFAKLVAEKEREECINKCLNLYKQFYETHRDSYIIYECIKAIRARGQE